MSKLEKSFTWLAGPMFLGASLTAFLTSLFLLDDGGEDEGKEDENNPAEDDPKKPKMLSQEEVNRIAAREKEQGKRAAQEELANQLGVSLDEAKEIIQKAKDREESEKSEAQKAKDQADKEREEAEKAKREAAQAKHETKLERLFVRAGIDPDEQNDKGENIGTDKLSRVMRMATIEVGAEDDALSEEVESIKSQFPELFTAKKENNGGGKAPSGDPPGKQPKRQKSGDSAYDKGVERAKSRFGRDTSDK